MMCSFYFQKLLDACEEQNVDAYTDSVSASSSDKIYFCDSLLII